MKDKETGLTFRTLKAVELFAAETIVRNNAKYTFKHALRDAGYTERYAHSFGAKIWQNMTVQGLIAKVKASLTVKTAIKSELTREKVLEHIEFGIKEAMFRKNLPALARFAELEARTLGMLTDNVNTTDTVRQRELDERAVTEATELARLRLGEKYGLSSVRAAGTQTDTLPKVSEAGIEDVTSPAKGNQPLIKSA